MRIDLPGGGWADLRGPDDLTGSDQDAYFDAYDEIMAAKPQPVPQADPRNPAVMLEPARPRFTNADGRVLRDKLLAMLITAWSYDHIPLPWSADAKKQLPVRVCNALYEATGPMDAALSGTEDQGEDAPKPAAPTGTDGSSVSSADGTQSLLQESAGEPSGTP